MDEAAVVTLASNEPSPEQTTIDRGEIGVFLSFLRGRDADLANVFSLTIVLGIDRPREIAENLSVSIDEAYGI